jgi:hypothetical protein
MGLPSMPKGEIVGMLSDRRKRMMVGMFNRKSILVIDGKIRVFLSFMASMEKQEQKISLGRPAAQQ